MVGLVLVTATAIVLPAPHILEKIALPRAVEGLEAHARLLGVELERHERVATADVLGFGSAAALDGFIRARRNGAHAADGTPEAVWRARLAQRFAAELTHKTAYYQFRIIGLEDGGREIVRADRSGPDGTVRIVPDDELQRQGETEYFTQTIRLSAGQVYVSNLHLDRDKREIETPHVPILRVATPVHGSDGALFGIVVINVDMRDAFNRMRAAALPYTNIYVVNETGDFLLHPDGSRTFGFEFGKPYRIQDEFPQLASAIAGTRTGLQLILDSGGDRLGVGAAPVQWPSGPWVAVIETAPYSVLMEAAFSVRQTSLWVSIVAVLGAIGLALLISRSLTRPLAQMTGAVQAFARDEPTVVPTSAPGEVAVLANAFERMAAEVRDKTTALKREIEERRRIFETSLDLILVVDRRGPIIRVSPSCMAILGYQPDEMIGRNAREFLYPNDLDSTRREMRVARRGRSIRNFECRHVHKDGRVVMLVWSGVWSEPEQRYFFIGRDMTEQRLVEEKFRLAVEACPSGMIMTDQTGTIVMVNSETERLFGYRRDELIGQPVELLVPTHLRAQHVRHRSDYTARPQYRYGVRAGHDLFGQRKDGTTFPIEVGLNPVHVHENLLILSVVIDITERQRNERLKDEFVATVSHELRTPLTSIAGSLGLLIGGATGQLPGPVAHLLSIAQTNSQRLVRLINDILDIEKMESGKVQFNFKDVDLRSSIDQAIEANRGLAEGGRIELDPATETATVRADLDRLTQVMTNLISNAVKFSPVGEKVTIAIKNKGDLVRVSVRDHGLGIPNDFKARIFEKFAQADASDARKKGGTGLGLNIVKQIISQHAGTVGFEDAPCGGTIFYFELPRVAGTAATDAAIKLEAGEPRLLLCDDDAEASLAMSRHLRSAGFSVDVVPTAAAARLRAAETTHAALLIDLQLPDLDGISLIQQLRADPRHAATPIIVISANPERGRDDFRSSALNVLDWLHKPVDVAQLVQVVNRAIAGAGGARPRILHVDDDADVRIVVAEALRNDADVVSVASISEARHALAAAEFDLTVLDLSLTDGVSLDLLSDLQNRDGEAIPVVVFSGQDSNAEVAARVDAMLTKSRTSIDHLVRILRRIVASKAAQAASHREVA